MKTLATGTLDCDNSFADKISEEDSMGSLNIIEALNRVQEEAFNSSLSDEFWNGCSEEIDYLCKRLELNRNQVVLIAVMCEIGEAVSWRRLGEFMGISRLKAMMFTPDMEDLRDKRWIFRCCARECGMNYEAFRLVYGVIYAFRHNKKFEPENIEGLSETVFIDRLTRYMCNEGQNNNIPSEDNRKWLLQLVEANPHLPLCRKVMSMEEEFSKIVILLLVSNYVIFGQEGEGISVRELSEWFEEDMEYDIFTNELEEGSQELFNCGLIEHGFSDGMVNTQQFLLTSQAKRELIVEYDKPAMVRKCTPLDRCIRKAHTIKEKSMYYNAAERLQIERLRSLFSRNGFRDVQNRLEESGLRRGVACLFYGAPGTGKTESVLQLARECGRDIMQIDIAGLRDKFVGESEKNIKAIFSRYKELCKNSETTPILFFNEADAIINNRFETVKSSVEKMDNAIQNIILQELEDLDGILIATTNLTCSLDKAVERRFLFKVEFSKPGSEAKKGIWHSMLPDISDNDCHSLATEFDFTGGQIENIARKCKIDYVISGEPPLYPKYVNSAMKNV